MSSPIDPAGTVQSPIDPGVPAPFPPSDIIITDLTGSGTISGKGYAEGGVTIPANAQLIAAESDNDSITIAFTVFARGADWQPITVTASGGGATPVISTNGTWTQVGSVRVFTGTVTLTDADTSGTITLFASDTSKTSFDYTRGADPVTSSGARTEQSLTRLSYSRSQTSQSGVTRRVAWI